MKIRETYFQIGQSEINKLSRRQIFRIFRKYDESHLFPINGKFDATERAIRQVQKYERSIGHKMAGLELWLSLDGHITEIVNSQI